MDIQWKINIFVPDKKQQFIKTRGCCKLFRKNDSYFIRYYSLYSEWYEITIVITFERSTVIGVNVGCSATSVEYDDDDSIQ